MSTIDHVLLERWTRERDAKAFQALVTRYGGVVYGTCRRVLGNDTWAEDATQECFLALAGARTNPGGYLGAWLHRVATNVALKHLRAEHRRRNREERYATAADLRREVEWDDIFQYVDEAIADLPEKLRAPLVAHFLQGQSHAEIAQQLGVTRQTVSHRIATGIERVREALARHGVTVSAVTLAALLPANMTQALPEIVAAKLGKLALAWPVVVPTTVGMGLAVKAALAVAVAVAGMLAYTVVTREKPAPPASKAISAEKTVAQHSPRPAPQPDAKPRRPTEAASPETPVVPEAKEAPPSDKKPSPTRADVEKALSAPVGIKFEYIALGEILDFLADSWNLNLVLDETVIAPRTPPPPSIPTPSTESETPPWPENPFAAYVTDGIVASVDLSNEAVPLYAALDVLLPPLGLAYSVEPGFIWISTPELIAATPREDPRRYAEYDMDAVIDQDVKIEFEKAPLSEICEFMADASEVDATNFRLDSRVIVPRKHLGELGSPRRGAVTDGLVDFMSMKDVQLRDALRAMLLALNLTYTVEEGFVFISTPEKIGRRIFAVPRPHAPILDASAPSLTFENTHLDSILAFLGEHAEPSPLEILVDSEIVAPCDVATGTERFPCDGRVRAVSLNDLPLRTALNALLRPRDLDYGVTDQTIWVTSPQRATRGNFDRSTFRNAEPCAMPPPKSSPATIHTPTTAHLKQIAIPADGQPRAQIQTGATTAWYKEGESFERYRVIRIDPALNACDVLDESAQIEFHLTPE